jgi:hypothetical protein
LIWQPALQNFLRRAIWNRVSYNKFFDQPEAALITQRNFSSRRPDCNRRNLRFSELTRNGSAVPEVPFMKLRRASGEMRRPASCTIASLFSYRSFYEWGRPHLETFAKAASRVGKGAFAPCPPSQFPDAGD